MPTAWELVPREYRWLIRRFGLGETARKTKVAVGGIRTLFLSRTAAGYYDPLTREIWLRRWEGKAEDVAKLVHELVHRAGFEEPAAYYTFFRFLDKTGLLSHRDIDARFYRVLMETLGEKETARALLAGLPLITNTFFHSTRVPFHSSVSFRRSHALGTRPDRR